MLSSIAYAPDKCIESQFLIATVVEIFEYRQLDVNHLLKGTGIFRQDLQLNNHKVSPLQFMDFIENALSLWPGDDLPFLLGQQWSSTQSGTFMESLFCCRGLSQMQKFWHQYHWVSQPWLQGWHWQTKNLHHLLLQLDIGAQRQQRFFIELTLSSLVSTYKKLTHKTWQGHFSLPYAKPKQLDQYYKYLGNDLSFNQPICVISYSSKMHQQPFENTNKQGAKLTWQQLKQYKQTAPFHIGLPAAIRLLLISRSYSLPQIADHLCLSTATLKRRLKAYNISFQQLQDQSNMQQAIFLLAVSGENNLTVAKQLQFADSNNFRRSFKRWTGLLPSQFKYWLNQSL